MNNFCEICKKKYKSYQSLWNHKRKFHIKDNDKQNDQYKENLIITNDPNIVYNCNYCKKQFINKYTLKIHTNTNCYIKKFNDYNSNCEHNNDVNNINRNDDCDHNEHNEDCDQNEHNEHNDKLKLKLADIEFEKLKLEQIKEEKEILKLKLKLNNKTIIVNNNTIKNINNLLNINNINNFQIIALGKENILDEISLIDKKEIIKSQFSCVEHLVKVLQCGQINQYKNIIITNLKDDYAYKYDETNKKFICVDKDEIMSELIDERLGNIKEIYEELNETNKIDTKTKKLIQDFLIKMNDENKYIEESSGKIYKNFRAYKEHKVKILIYNNLDKITKDLAIILEDPIELNESNYLNDLNDLNDLNNLNRSNDLNESINYIDI